MNIRVTDFARCTLELDVSQYVVCTSDNLYRPSCIFPSESAGAEAGWVLCDQTRTSFPPRVSSTSRNAVCGRITLFNVLVDCQHFLLFYTFN